MNYRSSPLLILHQILYLKIIIAFFRLIRWPNLVFIVLTQVLFEYCIYLPISQTTDLAPNEQHRFQLLILASVCIAAAGYIINDYFDLNIDQINRPGKVVVNTVISRRWVILLHMILSLLGMVFTFMALSFRTYWYLILANALSILLLWIYSSSLKKRLLIGNILISVLTAWVIGIIYFSKLQSNPFLVQVGNIRHARFLRITLLYAGFAFVISLVREVLKDMEDMEGDRKFQCRTMPIVWGVNASKVFVAVWLTVLIATLILLQLYVLQYAWWLNVGYCILFIIIPLIWVFRKLYAARSAVDYHRLSSAVKMVMFTGILSMFFFLKHY